MGKDGHKSNTGNGVETGELMPIEDFKRIFNLSTDQLQCQVAKGNVELNEREDKARAVVPQSEW